MEARAGAARRTRKPGQSAHAESSQGVFPWKCKVVWECALYSTFSPPPSFTLPFATAQTSTNYHHICLGSGLYWHRPGTGLLIVGNLWKRYLRSAPKSGKGNGRCSSKHSLRGSTAKPSWIHLKQYSSIQYPFTSCKAALAGSGGSVPWCADLLLLDCSQKQHNLRRADTQTPTR